MSTRSKWHRQVRVMAEGEGLKVVSMSVNGGGHISCQVSLNGAIATATVSNTPGCWRAPLEARANFRRLARALKQKPVSARLGGRLRDRANQVPSNKLD